MSINPDNLMIGDRLQAALSSAWSGVQSLFSHSDLSPEEALIRTPNIDPAFIPRVPMSNANIDVHLLNTLGAQGLKRGKEITAATHPELYHAWASMSARAGLNPTPQLILAESKVVNAQTMGHEEVVVTTGLLKALNLREVRAVLGHELGHATSDHMKPRLMALALVALPTAVAGNLFALNGGFAQFVKQDVANPGMLEKAARWLTKTRHSIVGMLGEFAYLLTGAAVGLVAANQLTVRPTELDADRKGVMISGDPEGLISALSKLEATRQKKPLQHMLRLLQSGYPSTEHRIRSIREVARTMPAGEAMPLQQPVMPPEPPVMPEPPIVAADANPQSQVHGVAHVERVGSPVPSLATSA